MHILIVNFSLKDITVDQYEEICNEVAWAFAQVPGLLSKVWLADRESNTFGGVYTWRDAEALRAFQGSELFQNVIRNPHLGNIIAREFGVLEAPTRVTNGSPVAAAA